MITKTKEKPKLDGQARNIAEAAQALLEAMVRHVSVLDLRWVQQGSVIGLEVQAHAYDQPTLIGTGGRHIGALNALLREMAARNGFKIVVNLLEPKFGYKPDGKKPFIKSEWPDGEAQKLLGTVSGALFPGGYKISEQHTETISVYQVQPELEAEALPNLIGEAFSTLFDVAGKVHGRLIQLSDSG